MIQPLMPLSHPISALTSLIVWMGLCLLIAAGCTSERQPIDRFAVVSRHNVHVTDIDPLSPLSVGNGDFAFTADATGLQTFETLYHQEGIPLETMCTWAWHSFPNPEGLTLQDAMQESDFHGRKVAYASLEKSPAGAYFRMNPHPIPLGQIGLATTQNTRLQESSLSDIHQELDLWQGFITSQYKVDGTPVRVETVSHPEFSMVAFTIQSPLITSGQLKPSFRFPYSYDLTIKNNPPFDWSGPERHLTEVVEESPQHMVLRRTIDDSTYYVTISWEEPARWNQIGPHQYVLDGTGSERLTVVCRFSPNLPSEHAPSFAATQAASCKAWIDFWTLGGMIDFSHCTDPRAMELERRTILSQYLVKVNYSGNFPPQETGLTHISWFGKHNSEMYWWHAAQFYQWNHTELLEKGLGWYQQILPVAKADAKSKGFEGARWPKMSGIDGRPGPGGINPFIIWNQPNPIYLSELVYRAKPTPETLERYAPLVFESAAFLSSYAFYDQQTQRFILGPPVKNVGEQNEENTSKNPSFELAFWHYGLQLAQQWRERMHLERVPRWDSIIAQLAPLTTKNGFYIDLETEPNIFDREGSVPSSMLMALGYLPQTAMVDTAVMRATFHEVTRRNGLQSYVSWSLGKGALTAARLGDTHTAVDILCNDAPAAQFLNNGHVRRPKEPSGCPAYLPVNASFLSAIGLMAAGWDGAPDVPAPGFPQDGSWNIHAENLNRMP